MELQIDEEFIGLFEVPLNISSNLVSVVKDTLL